MSRVWMILGGALALVLAWGWFATRPHGTDQEQIIAVLTEAERTISGKDLRGTLGLISESYHGTGGTKPEVSGLLLQAYRDSAAIRPQLGTPTITVKDGTATVLTKGRLTAVLQSGAENSFQSDLVLTLRREDRKRYLIYPVQEWKFTSANIKTGLENLF